MAEHFGNMRDGFKAPSPCPLPAGEGSDLIARRTFLGRASIGMGSIALAGLLQPRLLGASGQLLQSLGTMSPQHFAPTAKRVIFLCMAGGP
jgi:hypothetical protein